MGDPYSFRPPKGAMALRRIVHEAIGTSMIPGVVGVIPDPRLPDTVYVITKTRAARVEIQARAARVTGVQHTGAMREYQQRTRETPPTCRQCTREHWPYQLCETGRPTP